MDLNDSGFNLFIGIIIGVFLGVGLAYLVLWSVRRQARMTQKHIAKHELKLGSNSSMYLISNRLAIVLDEDEMIVSDIKQPSPERISYGNIESVKTEWQQRSQMHLLSINLKSGKLYSYRIMQAYHNNFSGQPAKNHKNAVIITDYMRQKLEASGVLVATSG